MADVDELQALQPGDLLADRAYRQLSRAILGSQLPAGTPLSVPELAQRLNISRSPVREAVQKRQLLLDSMPGAPAALAVAAIAGRMVA